MYMYVLHLLDRTKLGHRDREAMEEGDDTDPEHLTTEQFLRHDNNSEQQGISKAMGYNSRQQQQDDSQHFIYTDLSNTNVAVSERPLVAGQDTTYNSTTNSTLYAQLNTIHNPSIYSQPQTPMKNSPVPLPPPPHQWEGLQKNFHNTLKFLPSK